MNSDSISELTTCGCASTTAYHRDLCVNRCTGLRLHHAHVMFVVRCSVCRSVLLVVMFRSHMIHIDSDSERGSCDGGTLAPIDAGVVQSGIQLLKILSMMAKNNRVPGEWVGCRPNPCGCREKRDSEREEL